MLKEILQMALDLKASDIIISANCVPSLKIM
jgi:Tfp pilus assembly pilus retraction ATPase PilT